MQRSPLTLALTPLMLVMSSAVLFADAATVTFKNRCPHDISVYDEFNRLVCKIDGGSMHSPTTGCSRNITKNGGVFRHTTEWEATRANPLWLLTLAMAATDCECWMHDYVQKYRLKSISLGQ